jgi:ornithine cyclodeaminase
MTRFIDVPTMSDLAHEIGVDVFIGELADQIEENFKRWEDFDKSARFGAHNELGVIELMPVADADGYGFKYVNGHPDNPTNFNMPTVMAFGALSNMKNGYPLLLSELTVATAMRTAATSLMAARAVARKDSKVMALIGNGSQSEFQAIAFHKHLGIEEIRAFDLDPAATQKMKQNLAEYPNLKVTVCASTTEACKGADIITTVTADKAAAIVITPDMIEPGMHLNGVGGDCPGKTEMHADVARNAKVFVEFEPQTRIEGEIQQLEPNSPVHDLWRVLTGEIAGRDSADQVTLFDSVGFALEDYSTLQYIYKEAIKRNIGIDIELVPTPDDPRDLFGHSRRGKRKLRRVV